MIDEHFVTVAAPLESSEPVVSRVMDGVQRYIANTDDCPADGAETVLSGEGYGDSVMFVDGFRFIEDLVAGNS